MVIKLPRSRESTPVAVTPPSTTLVRLLCLLSLRSRSRAMPRRASSRTGSKVDARRAQTVAAALDPLLDEADLPGEVPEFV